jgi:hypothetical protein
MSDDRGDVKKGAAVGRGPAPTKPPPPARRRDPRWIEYLALDELVTKFHPENPKDHSLDQLRASFERFGYTAAIELDERTGLLAAGHGRVEVLAADMAAGADPPEGIKVQGGKWLAPVQRGWSSTDDIEAKAYLIASNKLVEAGGWLDAPLTEMLSEIHDATSLVGTGYTDAELAKMMGGAPVDTGPQLGALTYQVIVECEGEDHQRQMIERLEGEGLSVRALIV